MTEMAKQQRKRLLARKEELLKRIEKVEDLLDDPKSQSFSEQATEREFDEVYEAQGMASEKSNMDRRIRRMVRLRRMKCKKPRFDNEPGLRYVQRTGNATG